MVERDELFLQANLADALAGEFRPAIDAKRRPHTVGRLVLAAFERGRLLRFAGETDFTRVYNPSWSPHTEVRVDLEPSQTRSGGSIINTFSSLSLSDPYDYSYELNLGQVGSNELILSYGYEFDKRPLSLELGSELAETRLVIAESAEMYFEASRQALARHIELS